MDGGLYQHHLRSKVRLIKKIYKVVHELLSHFIYMPDIRSLDTAYCVQNYPDV